MFVQSSLLHIMVLANFYDDSLDLSNLLFSSSLVSKIQYTTLLLTSCTSIIIGLGRILSVGDRPIVTSIFSDKILMMAAFILTKFAILAYMLCMVIRSMMWYYVVSYQSEDVLNVLSYNYRGFCKPVTETDKEDKSFCQRSECFSFFTVTIGIPIAGLVLLYIPSVTYILVIYIRKKKGNQFTFYYAVVCFMFAIMTNLSLFGEEEQNSSEVKQQSEDEASQNRIVAQPAISMNSPLDQTQSARTTQPASQGKTRRSQSLPPSFAEPARPARRHASLPNLPCLATPVSQEADVRFSLRQSNVLYLMFLVCVAIFLAADIFFQLLRQRTKDPSKVVPDISTTVTVASCLFLVNCALWVNFNWVRRRNRGRGCNTR